MPLREKIPLLTSGAGLLALGLTWLPGDGLPVLLWILLAVTVLAIAVGLARSVLTTAAGLLLPSIGFAAAGLRLRDTPQGTLATAFLVFAGLALTAFLASLAWLALLERRRQRDRRAE